MNLRSVLTDATDAVRGYWQGPLNSSDPGLSSFFGAGARTVAGVTVNEGTALSYAPVWNAVRLIAGHIGSLPLHFYKSTDAGKDRFEKHPLYRLLHDVANPELSADEFREVSHAHVLLWGNSYAEIIRNGLGQPAGLYPIHPARVEPFRDQLKNGSFGPMQYRVDGGERVLDQSQMLHIRGLSPDGQVGYSVIAMARQSLGLGIAAEQFGSTFFGNGSTFGGILTHPGKLTKEAKQGIRESIESTHQGPSKAHKFIVLGEGMTYETMGIPPNDAQFLESRVFQVREVARWFNVPPSKLGDLADATYSNTEQANIAYVVDCLTPWFVRWEKALLRQLVSPVEQQIQSFKFDPNALLRGDSQSRSEFYSKLFNIGVMSINDIREKEDLNNIGKDGDLYFVPVNLQSAEFAGEKPQPKTVTPPINPQRDEDIAEIKRAVAQLPEDIDLRVEGKLQPLSEAVKALEAKPEPAVVDHTPAIEAVAESFSKASSEWLTPTLAEIRLLPTYIQEAMKPVIENAKLHLIGDAEARATKAVAETETVRVQLAEAEHGVVQLSDDLNTCLKDAKEARTEATQYKELYAAAQACHEDASARASESDRLVQQFRSELSAVVERAATLDISAEERATEIVAARSALELATSEAQEARTVAEAAQQDAETARVTAKEAEHRAKQAEDEAKETEAQRKAALLAVAEMREAGRTERFRMPPFIRGMFADAMGRMVRRETEKARRNQLTPAKLRAWAEGFYLLHEDTCVEALKPAMAVHLAWMGSDADVETATRELIQPHLASAVRQLRAIADGDPEDYPVALERILTKWETDRPNALADVILHQEITHVGTL